MSTARSKGPVAAVVALVALAGLVVAAGPGTFQASAQEGTVVEVHLVQQDDPNQPFAFDPMELTIEVGTTVRWINDEDVFHTVTSTDNQEQRRPNEMFDETLSSEGDTFEYTFDEAGTFEYYCKPHSPFMYGTITVTAAGGANGDGGDGGDGGANGDADPAPSPLPAFAIVLALFGLTALVVRRRIG